MLRKIYLVFDAIRRGYITTGWLRSVWTRRIETRRGEPLPWLSYPAIHFLDTLDLAGVHVFEFGSGTSTLYWHGRTRNNGIRRYAAIECHADYHEAMCKRSGFYRDNVALRTEIEPYFFYATNVAFRVARPFDITIVDGPILTHRLRELDTALAITRAEGLIIVDDANWLREPLLDFCEKHHLFRIDFAGFAPGVTYAKVTSFLFREAGFFTSPRLLTPVAGMEKFPGMK